MKRTVGVMLVGALALAGCGSDDDKAADGAADPGGESAVITGLDTAFGDAGVARTPLPAADGDRLPLGHGRQGREDLRRRASSPPPATRPWPWPG